LPLSAKAEDQTIATAFLNFRFLQGAEVAHLYPVNAVFSLFLGSRDNLSGNGFVYGR